MPQSCSLQRQLDRYMATLPSVNPGALARASSASGEGFVHGAACSPARNPCVARSIITPRQLCTAVSKPFISQKRLPVDLVFIYVSKYIAGNLLPPSCSSSCLRRSSDRQGFRFCTYAVGGALQVEYRCSRLREFSAGELDETKIDGARLIFPAAMAGPQLIR